MAVSKSDFVRALQCQKMLWLDSHAPEYKIIPPEIQARLDAGNDFGDKAMGIFGPFVETTSFKEDGRLDFSAMIAKTQALLASNEDVICEGSFSWYGNFCSADILKREENGYALYEVKNTYFARREFIVDLGFQRLILRKCGVPVPACKLVLRGDIENIPDEIQKPDEPIEDEDFLENDGFLYRVVDVTKAVKQAERIVSDKIFEFGKLKRKDAEMPCIEVGSQCDKPYRCWYYDFCHKEFKNE